MKELGNMQAIYTYCLKVQDRVDEKIFNATSPLRITVVRVGPDATLFTICADQSGLIGLIRHLHGQGFVLLSVYRER
jgi:hypothetical protein